MLYLFNSAFRALYLTNVLNTLAYPEGYSNEYRYKHTGEYRYISPAFYANLHAIEKNEECVIIFIDRFGQEGYVYHPLRFGRFVVYRDVNEYVHFRVKLGDFVSPRNPITFNRELVRALTMEGIPRLTENDQLNTHDGYYAIKSGSIFGNKEEYQIGKPAWNTTVEAISKARALATTADQAPIFLMLDINTPSKKSPVLPKPKSEGALYRFHKATAYELTVTYRFPRQRTDQNARAKLQLDFGDSVKGQQSLDIDSHANSVTVSFIPKRYVEETRGAMRIAAAEERNLSAVINLQYEIRETEWFWTQAILALALFSIIAALIGVDFSTLNPLTIGAVWHASRIKLFLGLVQTGILFWLFRLIGKKVF